MIGTIVMGSLHLANSWNIFVHRAKHIAVYLLSHILYFKSLYTGDELFITLKHQLAEPHFVTPV